MQETGNNELQNMIDQIKVGQMVSIVTTESSMVAGMVQMIVEYLDDEGDNQKCYRIRLGDNHSIDIPENVICSVKIYVDYKECLQAFGETYEIECFAENDTIKPAATIINDVLTEGVWDKLSDKNKEKLIESLSMGYDSVMDLINALNLNRKENNRLHDEVCELTDARAKALKEAVDLTKKYKEIVKITPQYEWAFELIFEWLGVGKLLEAL